MQKSDLETKLLTLEKLFEEALDLLNEVKPYRSIFYKQKVAHLKTKLKKVTADDGTKYELL